MLNESKCAVITVIILDMFNSWYGIHSDSIILASSKNVLSDFGVILRNFYKYFDQIRWLRMWKMQLLDQALFLTYTIYSY